MNERPVTEDRIPAYVGRILGLIESEGHQAYVAGGAVRDIVLGKTPHDYDVATSARPEETLDIFKKAGLVFKRIQNIKYLVLLKYQIDLTLF